MQASNSNQILLAQADSETERIAAKAQELIAYVRDHGRDTKPGDLAAWIEEVTNEFKTHCMIVVSGIKPSVETIGKLQALADDLTTELKARDGAEQAAYQEGYAKGVQQAQGDSLLAEWADAISGAVVYEEQ